MQSSGKQNTKHARLTLHSINRVIGLTLSPHPLKNSNNIKKNHIRRNTKKCQILIIFQQHEKRISDVEGNLWFSKVAVLRLIECVCFSLLYQFGIIKLELFSFKTRHAVPAGLGHWVDRWSPPWDEHSEDDSILKCAVHNNSQALKKKKSILHN